jgi:cysteine desulfurase
MTARAYLDWNATAPLREEARAAMLKSWDISGNPSSVHAEGRDARHLVEAARRSIATAAGISPGDVIFTSGGTESNAFALNPGLKAAGEPVQRLLVSEIEHPSVLAGGGFGPDRMAQLPVAPNGLIDLDNLRDRLRDSGPPAQVSVMAANNETGAIQPIADVAEIVHAAGGVLHVDAVQTFGRIPCDFKALGADLASVSGHKLGGPKGVGALLLINPDLHHLAPLIRGGGQERNRRAGTENVSAISGFGAAVVAAQRDLATDTARIERLRGRIEAELRSHQGVVIFADTAPRLPNTTLFSAPGLRAETAVIAFDLEGVAISSGSACSSGKVQPSHVLRAMGVQPELANGALRISLGYQTKDNDIDRFIEAWRKLSNVLGKVRRNSA